MATVSPVIAEPRYKDRGRYKERKTYSYACNPSVCVEHAASSPHCYCGVALEPEALRVWAAMGHDWRTLLCFWCLAERNGFDRNDLKAIHRWLTRDRNDFRGLTGGAHPRMAGERGW